MRLLLVDDEAGIREGLAALLRLRGYEVRTADCVATACRLCDEIDFDLLLTDWRLPDGTAEPLLGRDLPTVAISGHPDEVARTGRLLAVLAKPVLPDQVIDLLRRHGAAMAPPPSATAPVPLLPLDAAAVVARAEALLREVGVTAEIVDDGTFATLRARWPGDAHLERFVALGGDLRILGAGEAARLELRWCRDGRPDPGIPTVAPTGAWPPTGDFCVDWHGAAAGVDALRRCHDRAESARATGARVQFLNVSPALARAVAAAGHRVDLDRPARIGPAVPPELAELWR